MNAAHFHLLLNHLPIVFPVAGMIVMITGVISKSAAVKRAAYLIFIIGALTSFAAMTSGEGAEEVVEHLSGVTENYIKRHEETAEVFSILTYILGALSLLGLWASFKRTSITTAVSVVTLAFAAVVLYFARLTGTSGGEIRHTEIRSEKNVPPQNNKAEGDDD